MGEKRRGTLGDLAHVRNSPGGVMSADGNTESFHGDREIVMENALRAEQQYRVDLEALSFSCAKQNSKMISVSLYNLPVSVFSAAGNTANG